jgi:DNA invertase Pin-like site-specific DNA recombinase
VALDLGIDTSTPGGRLVANVFASVAEWERETIAARTRDGLAAVRAQGRPISRPAIADNPEIRERILRLRAKGMSMEAVASALTAEGYPTLRGGERWRASSVQSVLGRKRRPPRRRPANLPAIR